MLFNSFIFLVFLAVVLPIFFWLPTKKSKNIFLTAASYFFYGYWDWRFCLLLLFSTVVDFYVGQKIYASKDQATKKKFLLVSLIVNLGVLGFFKYFNFFVDSFNDLATQFGGQLDFLHLNIILPVGISFYTFQTLSYSIDIYRGKLVPTNNLIDFSLFVAFFPQLVAGPIERASNLLPQLTVKLKPNRDQINKGIELIISGLFRKVMLGDTAGRYVDQIFGDLAHFSSWELICALILFSIQIYADFSGYSHIARGTAKLLGVELMKNFEQPYLSRNITEFWRRWHISLSSWLKDYLYISLGGNRKGINRTYVNLFITMLLGGLWHGASWNFVIWGGLHGVYLAFHKMMLGKKKIDADNVRISSVGQLFTFVAKVLSTYLLVLFTWLFFRSTSWAGTELFLHKLLHWETSDFASQFGFVTLTYMIATLTLDLGEYITGHHTFLLNMKKPAIRVGILAGMLLITLIFLFQADPLPFIYFQF